MSSEIKKVIERSHCRSYSDYWSNLPKSSDPVFLILHLTKGRRTGRPFLL